MPVPAIRKCVSVAEVFLGILPPVSDGLLRRRVSFGHPRIWSFIHNLWYSHVITGQGDFWININTTAQTCSSSNSSSSRASPGLSRRASPWPWPGPECPSTPCGVAEGTSSRRRPYLRKKDSGANFRFPRLTLRHCNLQVAKEVKHETAKCLFWG